VDVCEGGWVGGWVCVMHACMYISRIFFGGTTTYRAKSLSISCKHASSSLDALSISDLYRPVCVQYQNRFLPQEKK
jgi:hypothetical protein